MKSNFTRFKQFAKRPLVIVIAVTLVLILFFVVRAFTKKPVQELVTVTRGTIAEEVTVTGATTPSESVDLAFERGGRIIGVFRDVGDRVTAGAPLVELDSQELRAQLLQAQANVATQEAKLDQLAKGPRQEDIEVSQSDLAKAEQDLANDYNGIPDTANDGYTKAVDAVRKQTLGIFQNDETNPTITFSSSDSRATVAAQDKRAIASQELNHWNAELAAISTASSRSDLENTLEKGKNHLLIIRQFLKSVVDLLSSVTNLSASTLSTYQANMTTAQTNVTTALTNINNQIESIASQKTTVEKAQSQLRLTLAGSDPEEIKAQQAQVAQAQAQIALIEAQLAQMVLRSPIDGVITKQDAKVGQIAAVSAPLTSLISQNKLEIDANVPEVDIGKIALANLVLITFDALPGETSEGKVIHIDPAQTVVSGVVNFKIKVAIQKSDPRVKSGLTANLDIMTRKKDGVLILPQYAVLETDVGTFVKKSENGKEVQISITTGIRDQKGNIEVISGVSEGDKVLNIGAKQSQ